MRDSRSSFDQLLADVPQSGIPFMPITMMFAADLGAVIHFPEDAPPAVREETALLAEKQALTRLRPVRPEDGERMANRIEAVRRMSEGAERGTVIEGWVEGPCAEASDLRGINRLMIDFFDDSSFIDELFDLVAEQAILFARAQITAGARLIGIGDAASSLIGPELYRQYSLPRTLRLIDAVHAAGACVRLHICGHIHQLCDSLSELDVDMLDVDSMNSMDEMRTGLGSGIRLCGNLDPVRSVRDGSPDSITTETAACHRAAGDRFLVGAGCEIPRDTPHENLRAMQEYARRGG